MAVSKIFAAVCLLLAVSAVSAQDDCNFVTIFNLLEAAANANITILPPGKGTLLLPCDEDLQDLPIDLPSPADPDNLPFYVQALSLHVVTGKAYTAAQLTNNKVLYTLAGKGPNNRVQELRVSRPQRDGPIAITGPTGATAGVLVDLAPQVEATLQAALGPNGANKAIFGLRGLIVPAVGDFDGEELTQITLVLQTLAGANSLINLDNIGAWSLLLPNDKAFRALYKSFGVSDAAGLITLLGADAVPTLEYIVAYHIVNQNALVTARLPVKPATVAVPTNVNLFNQGPDVNADLTFAFQGKAQPVTVNGKSANVKITAAQQRATVALPNVLFPIPDRLPATAHVIDTVLLPPGVTPPNKIANGLKSGGARRMA
jgi:uncharacterized surface protein with fasciclin (FAS1) repeats